MDNFFDVRKSKLDVFNNNIRKKVVVQTKINISEGLFTKCESCNELIFHEDLLANLNVCPHCNYYFRLSARRRIQSVVDKGVLTEMFLNVNTTNPLNFPGYLDKISQYQESSQERDAFVCGKASIKGIDVAIGALDSNFMMGSMGSAVGEKVTKLIEFATLEKLPLVIFSASGGARMQEGIFSLMQMAKTSAALKYHSNAKLLYISVLTNPTTGGVAASFASLGDINIAETKSLIGFAGPRVIKQTINQELPAGFQTAEFQLEKGFVDLIVERHKMRDTIGKLLKLHKKEV